MRRTRRGNAANPTIAHAKESSRRLVRAGSPPHLGNREQAILASAREAILARARRPDPSAQQTAIAVGFTLSVPIDAGNVAFTLPTVVGTSCARLVYEFYEITTATRRRTTP